MTLQDRTTLALFRVYCAARRPPAPSSPRRAVPILLALLAAAFLALGATAEAAPRPATDPVALHEVRMGLAAWAQHGVTGCPGGVELRVASERYLRSLIDPAYLAAHDGDVLEAAGACQVTLSTETYRIAAGGPYDHTDASDMRMLADADADRCAVIYHGLGHALADLDDDQASTDPWIVDTMAQGGLSPIYPECVALARAEHPVKHRRSRASSSSRRRAGAHVTARRFGAGARGQR